MSRMKPEDLTRLAARLQVKKAAFEARLLVCSGTGCHKGGRPLLERLQALLTERGLERRFSATPSGCHGLCAMGPILAVEPAGVLYQKVRPEDLTEILESHLLEGKPVERLLTRDPEGRPLATREAHPFLSAQRLVVLRNRGRIDPDSIEDAICHGAYQALARALTTLSPAQVLAEVLESGLRGRGGAGFPTGRKWQAALEASKRDHKTVLLVCNADEGAPGAFMGRTILESDPHAVLEGMAIAAYALGARTGFLYTRKDYPLAQARIARALEQAREHGLLGQNILGTALTFDTELRRAGGAFVAGEASAVVASLAGRAGEPRDTYIRQTESGLRGKPTLVNNVETWANVPAILARPSAWPAPAMGAAPGGSVGTKVVSLAGDLAQTGLAEVPLGTPLSTLVEKIGAGPANARPLKALQVGGPSGGCLPPALFDTPLDYESLAEAGAMLGSGVVSALNERKCMVDLARYSIEFLLSESCGKCGPCREGLRALEKTLKRVCAGQGQEGDLDALLELSATIRETSLCQLGGTAPMPLESALRHFRAEFEQHISEKKCRAGACKALVTYAILEQQCTGCTLCARACPVGAISGTPRALHEIAQEKCIKCGLCLEVCKFDAVEVR